MLAGRPFGAEAGEKGCQRYLQSRPGKTYIPAMAKLSIDQRFSCGAELRAARFRIALQYDDIGERLMELRKVAWDRYDASALWSVPPHATYDSMYAVIDGLRSFGDLEAAYLAAAILQEIEHRTGDAT